MLILKLNCAVVSCAILLDSEKMFYICKIKRKSNASTLDFLDGKLLQFYFQFTLAVSLILDIQHLVVNINEQF